MAATDFRVHLYIYITTFTFHWLSERKKNVIVLFPQVFLVLKTSVSQVCAASAVCFRV